MEREMERITTVTVRLHGDDNSNIKVQTIIRSDQTLSVDNIFSRVCKTIGLAESSWCCFTLVEGASVPVRKLRRDEFIPVPCPVLCLRKWTFDVCQERALFADQVAVEMLCKHANYDIRTGCLMPDAETRKQLEDCLEPGFQAEAQFVSLCHRIPDYGATCFCDCVLQEPYTRLNLGTGSVITLNISIRGLHCTAAGNKQTDSAPWSAVRRWSRSTDLMTLTFDLVLVGSEVTLSIRSIQTPFMSTMVLEIIHILQKQTRENVTYFASDVRRYGNQMVWDNLLFDPGTENPVFVLSPGGDEGRSIIS